MADNDTAADQWERDCESLANIVNRLEDAPADVIYANEDAWWAAYDGLNRIYNRWLTNSFDEDAA